MLLGLHTTGLLLSFADTRHEGWLPIVCDIGKIDQTSIAVSIAYHRCWSAVPDYKFDHQEWLAAFNVDVAMAAVVKVIAATRTVG